MTPDDAGPARPDRFDPAQLAEYLGNHVGLRRGARLVVAYSGGLDSQVLLHALVSLRASTGYLLNAVHVDHGLHPGSADWAAHCRRQCAKWNVGFRVERLQIVHSPRTSLEAVAREARYRVLRSLLRTGESLITAHHQDDQAETVLLMLMRGSGVAGLAAMPRITAFGPGLLLRPLLDFTRRQLHEYALSATLEWVEDPSNAAPGFARNRVRHEVLPQLESIRPGATRSLARSAAHCAEANRLLDELAADDLRASTVNYAGVLQPLVAPLSVDMIRGLRPPRRANLLRYWCRLAGLTAPDTRQLRQICADLLGENPSGLGRVGWGTAQLHRYRNQLVLIRRGGPAAAVERWWDGSVPLEVPELGLRLVSTRDTGRGIALRCLDQGLWLRTRLGGEQCRLRGRRGRHKLKKLFQEQGIPPWERARLPLLYIGDQLAGVPGLWTCEPFAADAHETGLVVKPQGL